MPWKDPNVISALEALMFTVLAAVGGMLAYILRTLNAEKTPKWSRTLIEGASSGFVGLLAMLACNALGLDWKWSGMIVGIFGWLGAEASIAVLARVVRAKLGIDPTPK